MTGFEIVLSVTLGFLGILLLWGVFSKKINKTLKDTASSSAYLLEFGLIPVLVVGMVYLLAKLYKWILPKSWVYPALRTTLTLLSLGFLFASVWLWF